MTATAQQVLTAWAALPAADREGVLEELLRRDPPAGGTIGDAAFAALAGDVFLAYDAAEADAG